MIPQVSFEAEAEGGTEGSSARITLAAPGWRADLAWRFCEYLPETLINGLSRCLPYVAPFFGLRIPITILEGPTFWNDRHGTVLAAGAEPYIHYLPRRFLKIVVKREKVGVVPIWELPRTLKRLQGSVDLTVARIDRLSARLLSPLNYFAVPDWVGSWLDVPEDLTKWARASKFHFTYLRETTAHVSHERADFNRFYQEMYVPYICRRHGDLAHVRSLYQLRRCFDRGGILWLHYRGQPIAASLFQHIGNTLGFIAYGTARGEWPAVKTGTFDALKYYQVEYARRNGYERIDYGGSRPSLHDGVLRYKRKWGMKLTEKPDSHYDWMIHWNRLDEKVTSFLSKTSLVVRDKGGLSVIAALDREDEATEADAWRAHHLLWMPGLQRLYLVARSGWRSCSSTPPNTVLLDSKNGGKGSIEESYPCIK